MTVLLAHWRLEKLGQWLIKLRLVLTKIEVSVSLRLNMDFKVISF